MDRVYHEARTREYFVALRREKSSALRKNDGALFLVSLRPLEQNPESWIEEVDLDSLDVDAVYGVGALIALTSVPCTVCTLTCWVSFFFLLGVNP